MEIVLIVWNIALTIIVLILAGAVKTLLKASIQTIKAVERHGIEVEES